VTQDQAAAAKKHADTLPDGSILQMFWRAAPRSDRRTSLGLFHSFKCHLAVDIDPS